MTTYSTNQTLTVILFYSTIVLLQTAEVLLGVVVN